MQKKPPKQLRLANERAKVERKKAGRRETGSALLVCEGECTEPYYLKGLLHYLEINSASVEVLHGQTKSNAVAVVNRARERFEQVPRDRVFALIDAEQADLDKALKICKTPLQRGNQKKGIPEIRIEPIISTPCFEVWLLLHFRFCDQPFRVFRDVLPELQVHLPDYSKTDRKIFLRVGGAEGLQRALLNVHVLRKASAATGALSPSTNMDSLVNALQAIAPQG
jgi:hypothetical protein